ncbi:hypothetical protein BHU72_12015 [Desulfuribacillus stibiiarsenatis]|uniref:Carboxypeptidase regulatory-like domain-containing protein n=1 Tax=Desulfuribacillus stibiiarsenatis TaxID=1390249 RepID=A0A1E5L8I1_9FIRM|nr:carboxypeptidase-like regulatory domain-containing protein [Desulfuribacillus stibiiarsenatis]OEH86253.1 hypothetical protein BHU72_12015 [Desulfuribacillus stibiiarsenatis]
MTFRKTGYTKNTPKRYWVDAGAVYLNLVLDPTDGSMVSGELLGATSGGNQLQITQEKRDIPVDGVKGVPKGNTIITKEEPILTVNLKEITARNLTLALAGGKIEDANAYYDKITTKGRIELSDYKENIALVGRQSGTGKPIIVIIKNVISMEGINTNLEENNEAVIPIQFKGHYDEDIIELGEGPFEIYWPKEEGELIGVVSDSQGPVIGATVTLTVASDTFSDTTDADGKYLIVGIPRGTYSVTTTKTGYTTSTQPNVVIAANTENELNITLTVQ